MREKNIILQLSLGANIQQSVWTCGGAAPGIMDIPKGAPKTLCQYFAGKGMLRVLAYVLMLEQDPEKRRALATETIKESKNAKTTEFLSNFAAEPEAILYYSN